MTSQRGIYNLAFSHLGETTVDTLDADPMPPNVAKANAQWQQALETALTVAPWLCATDDLALTRDETPTGGWGNPKYSYRYTLPGGTLRVWSVDGEPGDGFRRGTVIDSGGAVRQVLWSTLEGPLTVQTTSIRPVEAMGPLLADALGMLLASRLAGPIQQDTDKAAAWLKRAREAFELASGSEATEIGGEARVFGDGPLALARASAA